MRRSDELEKSMLSWILEASIAVMICIRQKASSWSGAHHCRDLFDLG
jgi:hypothetical protein